MPLSSASAPAFLHNQLDFFSQDVPTCPSVSGWQPLWTTGTKELTAISFSNATMRFTQAHLQGFRAHFNSRDLCIWLSEADVGCPHLLVTDCKKYLQSQLLPLLTHGNKENSLVLVFCLDLSRLDRAPWDSKDKMESSFAFHCGREMFSHRFNSWSSQMLQALSRQLCQKWPEAHCPSCHCTNQRTKNLLTSPKQFQPWCKTSDNRWDQTDGRIEEENEAASGSGTGRGLSTLAASLLSSFFCVVITY